MSHATCLQLENSFCNMPSELTGWHKHPFSLAFMALLTALIKLIKCMGAANNAKNKRQMYLNKQFRESQNNKKVLIPNQILTKIDRLCSNCNMPLRFYEKNIWQSHNTLFKTLNMPQSVLKRSQHAWLPSIYNVLDEITWNFHLLIQSTINAVMAWDRPTAEK